MGVLRKMYIFLNVFLLITNVCICLGGVTIKALLNIKRIVFASKSVCWFACSFLKVCLLASGSKY